MLLKILYIPKPKQVYNFLFLYKNIIYHVAFRIITQLKLINSKITRTLRLKELPIILVLIMVVMAASCQASQVKPSQSRISQLKKHSRLYY